VKNKIKFYIILSRNRCENSLETAFNRTSTYELVYRLLTVETIIILLVKIKL